MQSTPIHDRGKIQMLFNALHVIVRKRWRRGICTHHSAAEYEVAASLQSPVCLGVHIKMPSRAYIKLGRLFTHIHAVGPQPVG